jgi:hypothetical protein
MYKFLLSTIDQEVYDFFSYVLASNFKAGELSDVAKRLNHSKNRMLMIIERVKELQEQYTDFSIEVSDRLEIHIHLSANFLLSKLYALMLEETIPFRILDHLFSQKYISLENTAQQYYISNRTVQRKLKELDRILSNYNIGLDLKSKSLFKGQEYRIRYFFHTMYWQVFDGNNKKHFNLTHESIQNLRQRIKEAPTHYRNIDIDKFVQIVALSVYRMKRHYYVTEIPSEMEELYHVYIPYDYFKRSILTPVFSENYLNIPIPETEYRFLYYMFSVITTYLPTEVPEQLLPSRQSKEICQATRLFAQTAQEYFGLPLTIKEQNYLIVNTLIMHSTSIVFASPSKIDAFGKTTTEEDYVRVFPVLYLKVKEMFAFLCEQSATFIELYKANDRLIFQYTMLLSLLLQNSSKPIRVFHESKFGKIQDAKQKKRIKQLFNDRIVFVEENAEIVLTDYPVDRQKFLQQNSKVQFFKWNSFQTTEKWIELIEYIEHYGKESHK